MRTTQAALALAAAGAIVILVGSLGTAAELIGLGAIVLGTVVSASAGRGPAGGWWGLLASGAVLSVLGAVTALASDSIGGLLALLGGIAVLSGAALGFPLGDRDGRVR